MKPILALLLTAAVSQANPKQTFDFNFDGHEDYRVLTVSDSKSSLFDVFIFDPKSGKHVKDKVLSGTIYPTPDPKTEEIRCQFTGGHSGALFVADVYRWTGEKFEYVRNERQDSITIGDQLHYVLAKSVIKDGKPLVVSIETAKPHWAE